MLARWRARCTELLVDEAQDLDRTQLELALLLAAPGNRVFLVGDDDQTIYGWRLADVRRVLGLAASLPGLRRVDLTTNYRCPRPVVERAVRLVEHNRERFAKRIDAGPNAAGRLVLAPDADDDVVRTARAMASWPADDSTRAVLARTNRELLVAVVAALDLGLPFRAPDLALPIEDPRLDALLDRRRPTRPPAPAAPRLALGGVRRADARRRWTTTTGAARRRTARRSPTSRPRSSAGRPGSADAAALREAIATRRERCSRPCAATTRRSPSRPPTGRRASSGTTSSCSRTGSPAAGPSADATEPERALEEERRLAYVAWTRARRSLTLLFDPAAPSRVPARGVHRRGARGSRRPPPRRLGATEPRAAAPRRNRACTPRRDRADDRARARSTCARPSARTPAVRALVQRRAHVADARRWPRRCRSRRRRTGSSGVVAQPGQGRLPLRDLPPRGRPADRHDRAVRAGPAQRQRGPRDLDRRPGGHGPGLRQRRDARARRLGLRHAPPRADLARRLRLQPARAARLRASWGSSTRGRRGTRPSASASYVDVDRMSILAGEWRALGDPEAAP